MILADERTHVDLGSLSNLIATPSERLEPSVEALFHRPDVVVHLLVERTGPPTSSLSTSPAPFDSNNKPTSATGSVMPRYPDIPETEYKSRISNAVKVMNKHGLDGLFLTQWENVYYLTGYENVAFYLTRDWPYALLIKNNGDVMFVVRGGTEPVALETSWVSNLRPYPAVTDAGPTIKQAIADLGLKGKRVGAELGQTVAVKFSTGLFLEMMKDSGAQFVDAAPALWELRQVKSKLEIDRIREAAKIASRGAERAFGKLKAGMTEREFSRLVGQYMIEEGADIPTWPVIIQSGEKFKLGLGGSFPSDIKINIGGYVQADFGAMYKHYSSDLNRMAIVGVQPTQAEKDHWNTYVEANKAGTKAVRAGVTAADIFQAMANVFEQSGLKYTGFRAGHGLGLDPHEPPHLGPSDKTVVKNGMVFAIEPFGVPNKDGVKMNCEDDVVCTESGPERLSPIKQEIFKA